MGGVKGTRYPLKNRNHTPRATHHGKPKNSVPPLFFEKARDNKYDIYNTSNTLQNIRQNHWSKKYKSLWPTLILVSNFGWYWLITHKYDVNTSNILQDIRQNYCTTKCRSLWSTFILRSNFGSYWLIIHKHDLCTLNTLQDIRQNSCPWNISHSDLHLKF